MRLIRHLRRLADDRRGSMAIETAIVAPVLALMSVGAFQVSAMVARQSELQSAVAEAEAIVLAVPPTTQAQIDTVKSVIMASTGLPTSKVTVSKVYRCDSIETYAVSAAACGTTAEVSTFLRIYMTDTYTPQWTELGVGEPLVYRVTRTIQLS